MRVVDIDAAAFDCRSALLWQADTNQADAIAGALVHQVSSNLGRVVPHGATDVLARAMLAAKLVEDAALRWAMASGVAPDVARAALRGFLEGLTPATDPPLDMTVEAS